MLQTIILHQHTDALHMWHLKETVVMVILLSFLEVQVVRSHQLVQETPKSI